MQNTSIPIGSLYEFNQQLISKHNSPLSKEEIDEAMKKIAKLFDSGNIYYMLLCNEKRDYTVFRKNKETSLTCAKEAIECLSNRGQILLIDEQESGAFECWIRRSGIVNMYALFPYDAAVIEC